MPSHCPPSRRAPRFTLDVDWFLTAEGSSVLGRGAEVSVRGVRLPGAWAERLGGEVTLFLALPLRERMFKATCRPVRRGDEGLCLNFVEVTPDDLQLLGHTLIAAFGAAALPNLERRPAVSLPVD